MLYQHLELEAQPGVLDADKERTASILNGLKNDSSYKLTDEKKFRKRRSLRQENQVFLN